MRIEFTVTGPDARAIHGQAVTVAHEFFGEDTPVKLGAINVHRVADGMWKANVEAYDVPPASPVPPNSGSAREARKARES